ncbi:tetratricopeptide repeat protein [Streptomyces sp. NPDC005573]|uniref:tetratricopeptide repeat protein n=1 Tax=Streptomyces sp. NPDC005573 TaxID=3156890 RepID=UPI0033BF0A68
MGQEPVSRQELIRRRRSRGFVGRLHELAVFRENLARDPSSEAYQFLFHVHGLAGVGKSTLIRRWEAVAREAGAVTAVVGEEAVSAVEAMEAISSRLARQGCPLRAFDKQLGHYRQKYHEAEAAMAGLLPDGDGPGTALEPTRASALTAQIGMAGLSLVPGVGAFSGVIRPEQVAAGLDRARAVVGHRLRSHEDTRLVMSPLEILTPSFLADLGGVAERRPWVVLLFDTYERTAPLLDTWLRDALVNEVYGPVPVNVQAVLCGQGRLDPACWADSLDLVTEVPLEPFTENEGRALLAARGVSDERVTQLVLSLSGRLPVLLDALARNRPQDRSAVDDPSDTAVERFLKWERDPAHRDMILACALPLRLNDDVVRILAPAGSDGLTRLRELPFLTHRSGTYGYHDVIRSSMLRLQRQRSPVDWGRRHTQLAAAFTTWRREQEEGLSLHRLWDDPVWRDHRLNETYHRLCARAPSALPEALHDTIHACAHSAESLRRWAQLLVQAGQDSDTDHLARTGQHLLELASQPSQEKETLDALLVLPDLKNPARALAYTLRGQDHRLNGRNDQAIEDYTTALSLDPTLARAHAGRGHAHRSLCHHAAALADFDHAIGLAPDQSLHWINRGAARQDLRHYEDALADFGQAVEIDPRSARALAFRGHIHHRMRRHRMALDDLSHALTLDPEHAWAYAIRGDVHLSLGDARAALADLDHSLALAPDIAWSHCWRGEAHRALGHHAEALADLEYAIALRPERGWFHYRSALVMRLTGAVEEPQRWRRALEILEAQAAEEEASDLARSNFLVALCGLPDWGRAESQLETFLSHSPSPHQVIEAMDDLENLSHAVPVDPERLSAVLGRLREQLGSARN